MAVSDYKPIWDVIDECGLNIDYDSLDDSLKCLICNKLLKDATLSTVCGCNYCYSCINSYIINEELYCPGGKENCKDSVILMDRNIVRIELLNKKISRLKVKCPNQLCSCDIALIEMENHMRLCSRKPVNCPYVPIGCNTVNVDKEAIEGHLNSDTLIHSDLLVELIQNLKNEVDILKEGSVISKLEIVNLKEELRISKDEISMLREELRTKNNEMELRVEMISNTQRQIENSTRESLTEIRGNLTSGLKKSELEFVSLREDLQRKEDNVVNMAKEMNEFRRRSEDAKTYSEDVMKEVNEIKEKIKKLDLREDDRRDELCQNIDGGITWRIERCSENILKDFFSESFFANNYKLCVYARIYRDDNIGLGCFIMKGDNDDKLRWPMRQTVTLSIVDQVTLEAHKSETYKYDTFNVKLAFERPKNDRNVCYIGPYQPFSFIKYSSIKKNPSVIVNDSLLVKCTVNSD